MQEDRNVWRWRLSAAAILIPLLLGILALQMTHSSPGAAKQTSPRFKTGQNVHVSAQGTVNVAHLPPAVKLAPYSQGARSPMTAAAHAAYLRQNHLNLPGISNSTPRPGGITPNYQIAPPSQNFEGINFTQSGCSCEPPDQALGTSSSYTLEGVNDAFSIYNFAGVLQSGPIQYASFFAPVLHNGDAVTDPLIYFDSSSGLWINVINELTPSGGLIIQGYTDVAISVSGNALGSWNLFQFDTNTPGTGSASGDWGDFPRLGVDQGGLWITTNLFDNSASQAFDGNSVWMLPKITFFHGMAGTIYNWNSFLNGLGALAFTITPAQELATPQAEFMITNDAAYTGTHQDLTLIAFTNTYAVNGGSAPTVSVVNGTLPVAYAEPVGAQQFNTTILLDTDHANATQLQYQGGHLITAWTTAVNWTGDPTTRDGAYWLDITPQLSTLAAHNPQVVTGWITNQNSIYGYKGAYVYYPVLEASSELDEALAFGLSAPTGVFGATYPSLIYTSRRATDAPNTMGQNGLSAYAIRGSTFYTGTRWGDYSAASLSTYQPYQVDGVRGYIWLAGEYMGTNSLWQTRIWSLRTE